MSALGHFKTGAGSGAGKPRLDFDGAKAVDAQTVGAILGINIQGSGCNFACAEHGIRGSDQGSVKGRMLWWHGAERVGDNVNLVQRITGGTCAEAVELLVGSAAPRPTIARPKAAPEAPKTLHIPQGSDTDKANGRAYLMGRGIKEEIIGKAEASGFLMYTGGAVLFVGYDAAGAPKSATRRGYLEDDACPKRDLSGSQKNYPAILGGKQQVSVRVVWIVEGGVDALVAKQILLPGAIIATGGCGARAWLEQAHVQDILASALLIKIYCENELTAEKQAVTDAAHEAQAARLRELRPGAIVELVWPRKGFKDLAEAVDPVALARNESRLDAAECVNAWAEAAIVATAVVEVSVVASPAEPVLDAWGVGEMEAAMTEANAMAAFALEAEALVAAEAAADDWDAEEWAGVEYAVAVAQQTAAEHEASERAYALWATERSAS